MSPIESRRKAHLPKALLPATFAISLAFAGAACDRNSTPTPTPTQPAVGCPANTEGIILYDGTRFTGRSLILDKPGDYDMDSMRFNRMASSICNPGKNHVTLLDKGRPSYYDASVEQLSGVDNNSADTVRVEPKGK